MVYFITKQVVNEGIRIHLINGCQPDGNHTLNPEVQLLFSPPSCSFLQPVFLQRPHDSAVSDGIKVINKVKEYYISRSHLSHTANHNVVEGNSCWLFLITFLPVVSVNRSTSASIYTNGNLFSKNKLFFSCLYPAISGQENQNPVTLRGRVFCSLIFF